MLEHSAHNPENEVLNPIAGIDKDPFGPGERGNGKNRIYDLPVVA